MPGMSGWLLLPQATTLGATSDTVDAPMTAPARPPSFADEFDGPAIDRAAWSFDTSRNAAGWATTSNSMMPMLGPRPPVSSRAYW